MRHLPRATAPTAPSAVRRLTRPAGALALALAATAPAPAPAQASATALEARIQAMEEELASLRSMASELEESSRRQEILTSEVRRLKEDVELPAELDEDGGQHGMGPAASKVYQRQRGVSIAGYGQGWYTGLVDDEGPNDKDSFDLVRNVLYFGYRFSDKLVLNTELEWEHASSGGGSVSVEFAQIDYFLSDAVNLRTGLMLAPIGFVNEVHEPLYYYGNQRPEVERSIIPSTWRENGVGLFGRVSDKLEYRAYLMNGLRADKFSSSGIRGGRQKGSKALAENASLALRLDYAASDELSLGASVYTGNQGQSQDLTIDAAGNTLRPKVGMTLAEVHAQWRRDGWQARALGAWNRLSDAQILSAAEAVNGDGPVADRMKGAYVELAYDLFTGKAWAGDKALDVFFRYEAWDTQDRVPAGFVRDATQDKQVRTWGVQYKPHPEVVFKLDYRDFGRGGAASQADQINLGFGWVF